MTSDDYNIAFIKYGRAVLRVVIVHLLLLFAWSGQAAATSSVMQDLPEKNVLVIIGFSIDYPATDLFLKGLRDTFRNQDKYRINIFYESLGLQKIAETDAYIAESFRFFGEKYAGVRLDAVISGVTLGKYMVAYAEKTFPGVPMLLADPGGEGGVPTPAASFNIVSAAFDYENGLTVIPRIMPEVRKLYVVSGAGNREQDLAKKLASFAEERLKDVELVFTSTASVQQMLDQVANAEAGSAILFTSWLKRADGRAYLSADVGRDVCRVAKAPVFTFSEHLLGLGVVGGRLFSLKTFGERCARRMLSILEGNATVVPEGIAPVNTYAFDWRELKRWNIDEGALPSGSRIEFREPSLWEAHREYILLTVIVILFESALVLGLCVNLVRRRKAEAALLLLNESLEDAVRERTGELEKANGALRDAKCLLEIANRDLDRTSRTDHLTGLFNRRHIEERIHEEYSRFTRDNRAFSIILADVDYFKDVNDRYGHDVGDLLLQGIASVIRSAVREHDSVSRWGGEEFLILLPFTSLDNATHLAERIRKDVQNCSHTCGGEELSATLTLGACSIAVGESLPEMFRRADQALYEGKRAGRNRVQVSAQ